ncbi:MAG TPA: hypothetical protein VFV09_12535 [Actinomycetota bacterium]|jgi:hypothetical protein|nr:hypothetical protein [Actinomycetota bacterium]
MTGKWVRLCVLLLAVGLLAPACGGGSDSKGESTPSARATEAEESPQARAIADADCLEYANSFAGFSPDPDQPLSPSSFTKIAEFMESVADKVPNEVSDDFRTLGNAYRTFAEGAGDLDFTNPSAIASITPEQLQRMEESLAKLDTEEVRTAAANIEKFVQEHCPEG